MCILCEANTVTLFLGIDPGLQGGMCFINEPIPGTIHNIDVRATPTIGDKDYDVQEMKNLITRYESQDIFATIETQIALPGQGLTSTLQTGKGFGILIGLLAGLGVPYQIVGAQQWQKKIFTGVPAKLDTKDKSIIVAKRLFPHLDFRRTERSTKAHDGLTDACCIAEYGRRTFNGRDTRSGSAEARLPHTPMPGNPEVCMGCGKMINFDEEGCTKTP